MKPHTLWVWNLISSVEWALGGSWVIEGGLLQRRKLVAYELVWMWYLTPTETMITLVNEGDWFDTRELLVTNA